MTFDLTILGSGSALPTSRRYPTAQALNVLERFFLIDCGEGTQLQLRNAKVKFGHINHIFISHLHGDHVFGLFGLLSTFNLLGRKTDLYIYGHSDLENITGFFRRQFAEEMQYPIHIMPLKPGALQLIFEDKVCEVFAFPLRHRVPSWGYLFKEKVRGPNIRKELIDIYKLGIKDIIDIKNGKDFTTSEGVVVPNSDLVTAPKPPRSYAYCSDTAYYERITKWIAGCDVLYHEATFADSERKIAKQTGHSTASQAAMIAKKAGVKKLVLGHFSNRYKELDTLLVEARTIFTETYLAEDLQTISI
ncbi:MAG: ribonuclease Z [Bacteroidales bacterium]|nr:ribonuclease Z [Bacteroidales bacterium]